MSEPNSGVPDNIADTEVGQAPNDAREGGDDVDLDLDEEKLEKWDEVKSDYQMDPDGKPMPNIWDAGEVGEGEPEHAAEQRNDAGKSEEKSGDDTQSS